MGVRVRGVLGIPRWNSVLGTEIKRISMLFKEN